MRKLFAALLALVAAACVAESDNPVSVSPDPVDSRLVGSWQKTNEKGLAQLRFALGGATGMEVTMISNEKGKRKEMTLRLVTTKIGEGTYLSVLPYEKDFGNDKNPGWIIGRYVFPDDRTLKIDILAVSAVKAAITDGKIKGKTTKSSARLNASPEELRAWIAATADRDRLFGLKLGTFRKVEK